MQSGLEEGSFWAFAAQYFCHAHNMTIEAGKDKQLPYESRFPEHPNIRLHAFGCLCSFVPPASTAADSKSKFRPRASRAFSLGGPHSRAGA